MWSVYLEVKFQAFWLGVDCLRSSILGLGAVEVKMMRGGRTLRFASALFHIILFLVGNSVF